MMLFMEANPRPAACRAGNRYKTVPMPGSWWAFSH